MAKLGIVIGDWMDEFEIDATAIQCWETLQHNYGINACTIMSMMSNKLMPSACETDIAGTAAMRCGYLTMSGEQIAIGERFTQQHLAMPDGPGGVTGFYNHDQMAMNAKTKDFESSWKLLSYF